MNHSAFVRHGWHLALAGIALLVLMFTSLGTAYIPLGPGNAAAGIAIACIKSSIVVWMFMRMRSATPVLRIVGITALACLSMLFGLSGVDYLTRPHDPALLQPAHQLPPLRGPREGR